MYGASWKPALILGGVSFTQGFQNASTSHPAATHQKICTSPIVVKEHGPNLAVQALEVAEQCQHEASRRFVMRKLERQRTDAFVDWCRFCFYLLWATCPS